MRNLIASIALFASSSVSAQAIKPELLMRNFPAEEIAKIEMPDLAFKKTQQDTDTYDKYFYFHREATSFDQAYGDVKECDSLAAGIRYYAGCSVYNPYGGALGGAIGGVIG